MRPRAESLKHTPIHHFARVEYHPHYGGDVPVLYLYKKGQRTGGPGETGRFQPLVDFIHAHSGFSITTRWKPVRGVGLLYDYFLQTEEHYRRRFDGEVNPNRRLILDEFCNALRYGTVNADLTDPTGLMWPPISSVGLLKGIGTWLDKVFDHFVEVDRTHELAAALPFFEGASLNAWGIAAEHRKKRRYSFLAHLSRDGSSGAQRESLGEAIFDNPISGWQSDSASMLDELDSVPLEPVYAFPKELVAPFIMTGFNKNLKSTSLLGQSDWTGRLFAALSIGGGRGSESLHMWTNDLQVLDGRTLAFLRHPEKFKDEGGKSRERVLLERYQRPPRTRECKRLRVGFKRPRLNVEQWAMIRWMPIDGFQEYLTDLVREYLGSIRPEIMEKRRRHGLLDHPFLLVSTCEKQGKFVGDPFTLSAARYSWMRGIERLAAENPGLEYGKEFGTTRHGMRHRFGITSDEIGRKPQDIQKDMHHRSILSTRRYTMRSDEESNAALEYHASVNRQKLAGLGRFLTASAEG